MNNNSFTKKKKGMEKSRGPTANESIDFNPSRMYEVPASFCFSLNFLENKSVVLLSTQLPPIQDNELNEWNE